MERQELKEICAEISQIIIETNNENVYDNIIKFFNLTSKLDDCRREIDDIPVAQERPNFLVRLFNRKKVMEVNDIIQTQEEEKSYLLKAIARAGRYENGSNRTKKGETVTKENVFFGARIHGPNALPIAQFEKFKASDPKIYNTIATQMTNFIKSFGGCFDETSWL